MSTNDERREVAARLRVLNSELWACYSEEYDDLRWACNADKYYELELHELLADLIEPEPERTCLPLYDGKYNNNPKCSLCGELLSDGVLKLPNYCGWCGAKVMA